ncbi:unnamed protein product [Choristocarpus tenellus]
MTTRCYNSRVVVCGMFCVSSAVFFVSLRRFFVFHLLTSNHISSSPPLPLLVQITSTPAPYRQCKTDGGVPAAWLSPRTSLS